MIALVLDELKNKVFVNITRVAVYIPAVLTPIIVGFIWYYILKIGLPDILNAIGVESRIDLFSSSSAFGVVVFVTFWMNSGVAVIIFSSGLMQINKELIQAAEIDGASAIQKISKIKIPLIGYTFVINLINTTIFTFKQFDQIYSMTNGGPGNSTEVLSILIYKKGFYNMQMGEAASIAYVLFFMILVITIIILKAMKSRSEI
jgi:ABC-type sugar transport system permease subunit